jgi:Mg/Co/Ni transporter MgtE
MAPARCVLKEPGNRETFVSLLEESGLSAAPVVDNEGRYAGVVTLDSLLLDSEAPVDATSAPLHEGVRLDVALDVLTTTPQTWATVIDDERHVVGTIALSDIVRNYRRTTRTYLRRLSEMGGSTGVVDVTVEERSPIIGAAIRSALVPRGAVITSVERGNNIIRPSGDTVLQARDRLTALGSTAALDALVRVARSRGIGDSESEE